MDWVGALRATTAQVRVNPWQPPDPHLGADLAGYVLEGAPEGVLARLLQRPEGLGLGHAQDGHPIRELYAQFRHVPHEVLIRWGRVLDAAESTPWRRHDLHVNGAYWPGTMLAHVGRVFPEGELPFDFFDFAGLLAEADVHSGRLLVHAWQTGPHRYTREEHALPSVTLARLGRYEHAVDQMHTWLSPLLVTGDVEHRLHALDMLAPVSDGVLVTYAEQVAEAAVSGSAQVRERAAPLVARTGTAGAEHLHRIALDGKPDQRRHALQLLWNIASDDAQRELALTTARADRAASVRAVADGFRDEPEADAVPVPEVAAPPAVVSWAVEWTEELAEAVRGMVTHQQHWWGVADPADRRGPQLAPDDVMKMLRQLLVSPEPVREAHVEPAYRVTTAPSLRQAVEAGSVPSEALIKLLVACGVLQNSYFAFEALRWGARLLHLHQGLSLRELEVMLEVVDGLDPVDTLVQACFTDSPNALGRDWAPDALWPFMAAHLDDVLDYWSQHREGYSYKFDSEALFPLIASFPEIPTRLSELSYNFALGTAKRDQRAAQEALSTHPDAVRRATEALSDGNGTVRSVAAEWLGRLGDRDAVPALASAFAHERNEAVSGTMLESLVALGETVESHFDLADTDAQAARVMANGLPAALKWLDPDRLPDVRRASGSGLVPRETMLWLIVGATKAKSSIPTALLKACVGQIRPEDAEAFGDALLALWIAADEEAVGRHSYRVNAYGERASSAGQPSGARGLFSVVAACGGAGSVADASRYVRTWHGQRAHQSKALVTMLAHHRHPAAAEALVAIAYRFKAPSIERQARSEVEELAQRRGWTQDQLADRTVPTAGFDDQGALHLSYGERSFTARLLPDCGIELVDADGKVLKALPSPRRGEEEAAKEAKRSLSAARKQLTETVKIQTMRLHDAMCVQRAWAGSEWREDIAGHPVLARLAARLVWVANGHESLAFRLLDDGTLTSAGDEPVELGDDAEVRIAHDVVLAEDEVAAWQQHLDDYEVPSLFAQLGRGRAELTDEEAAADTLDAHQVRVPIGRLEQAAVRRGYRRGAVGDAAAFDWFEKEFASLGLRSRAMIQGHGIEDHESDTVLEGLVVESTTTGLAVPLGQVPPVLLTELQHDLAAMVAQGTASGTAKG